MKSTKSPRVGLAHRGRSSRSVEGHGWQNAEQEMTENKTVPPPPGIAAMTTSASSSSSSTTTTTTTTATMAAAAAAGATSPLIHTGMRNVLVNEPGGIEAMRRKMSAALAQKQQMRSTASSPSDTTPKGKDKDKDTDKDKDESVEMMQSLSQTQTESSSDESLHTSYTGTMSTDSARTIRATFDLTPGTVRTPSYPFPRMQLRLNRGLSSRSGPSHKPFTLLSPTNEPVAHTDHGAPTAGETPSDLNTPMAQTPMGQHIPEDPNFPAPDLYDLVLMLNAEPGLDMWWVNVAEILSEAYGAERASLAVPGDITDLENVPWGQKATYSVHSSEGLPSQFDSLNTSEGDAYSVGRRSDANQPNPETTQTQTVPPRRPVLTTRHSIAGPLPESRTQGARQRPAGPQRAYSTATTHQEELFVTPSGGAPRLVRQAPTPRTASAADSEGLGLKYDSGGSQASNFRCQVHRTIQPLEAEPEPLLVRTGVAKLFGKREPAFITRTYSDHVQRRERSTTREEGIAGPSNSATPLDLGGTPAQPARLIRILDEFEQPEPSPWSQSPSPSPAARPDPSESPFFVPPNASIDEEAFQPNPPVYDYAATANQSLNAIGADNAKTLVHIPLVQPIIARGSMVTTLRFPIAILSFVSPLNPYPRSFRHSLRNLLPHLASSYSLAQQYSILQDRIRGGPSRHGAAFGLGGTFSDEGSELELVAELSGQVAQEKDKGRSWSYQASPTTPGEQPALRESPTSSTTGTPLESFSTTTGHSSTPGGKSGSEMVDSYFAARRQRGGGSARSPGLRSTKEDSEPGKRTTEKAAASGKGPGRKSSVVPVKTQIDTPMSPITVRTLSATSESETGDNSWHSSFDVLDITSGRRRSQQRADSKDESERPLPELISSLMLNAVPLQLFLAKPGSGDLVWTNRKFDAFRSQGEGRVRDPWKNVHSEDRNGLVKLWNEALRTGSQFTHYIRVKRFNSDSDFRWFVFRASTLLTNNGRLLYWIGSFLDVHEQYMKNLEASEREATMARDTKIRALADSIPQILFEAVEGEGIVAVNQQWYAYSGQTLDDARGLGFAKHVFRDDLHKCGLLLPSEVAGISRVGAQAREGSGSSDSSQKTAAPLPTSTSKNLFAPDLKSLDNMIKTGSVTVEKDENGRVSYLTEIRLRSRGGEYRWFLVRLVRAERGLLQSGVASWYGTCTDIETRKLLERELNMANEKVHSEMVSKTKFFANMSHEIRTPLNGILGSMPWLVESTLDHDQRRTVDTIQNSANNLRELVDNILDVTKVEAGKMTLLPKWFNVRTLCEEAVDTVASRAIERGLELNYSLEANVPSTVKGDAFRVRQVLLNLMGNSVKFTEQGEVYMRCSVREPPASASSNPVPNTAYISFEVTDTGRGFNPSDFDRLFKQFGQIGGGTNHDAGSGLGLFLSKQLVEMHGGELSVKSQAGEGSTFTFYIQVEVAPPGTEIVSPPISSRLSYRQPQSIAGSPRSRSDNKTPTLSRVLSQPEGVIQTPGLSRYVSQPDHQPPALAGPPSPAVSSPPVVSPPALTSEGSSFSMHSTSANFVGASSISSLVPTPESMPPQSNSRNSSTATATSDRQAFADKALAYNPSIRRSLSDISTGSIALEIAHPQTYSIIIICPAEYARAAIKQHIEHVVPYQIAANVTTIPDIGSFLDLMQGPSPPTFTHIVLDTPATSDIMLFMRQMTTFNATVVPALVIVTDHYQKRDIQEDFMTLTASGRKAFLIHKPVKPSVFAMIFDPAQLRNLSKDRAREVAQTRSDNFTNIAKLVKEKIGDSKHRILLVEDNAVNRMMIQRYLNRVSLANESANDGQQCVDMVKSHVHGYYSLIICDIQMPIKNGYQACTEVREWEQSHSDAPIPIMALTANAMPEERAAAGAAGFTDYLTKPVDFNVLGMMMMTLLDPATPHVFLRDRPPDS